MIRPDPLLVGVATLVTVMVCATVAGCPAKPSAQAAASDPGPQTPPQTAPAPPPAPTAPPPADRVRGIYEALARAPKTFDGSPHVSRFFVEQGRVADEACRAGRGCAGDRFACLDVVADRPGVVESVSLDGEQPGVSASVRLQLRFATQTTKPVVDVVFEDGDWRIDQVRCPAEDRR
jgi:hypothetical protein